MRHSKKTPADNLPLGRLLAPARRALENGGLRRLTDLTRFAESELAQLHGIGPNAMQVLKEALASQGLALRKD